MKNSQEKTVNLILLRAKETVEDLHNRGARKAVGTNCGLGVTLGLPPKLPPCFLSAWRPDIREKREWGRGKEEGKRGRDREAGTQRTAQHSAQHAAIRTAPFPRTLKVEERKRKEKLR